MLAPPKPRSPAVAPTTTQSFVAFGVGITEALPMAEAELGKPEAESVRLLWCSKTRPDTFWLDRAAALAAAHAPGRFEMVETFTREIGRICKHNFISSKSEV